MFPIYLFLANEVFLLSFLHKLFHFALTKRLCFQNRTRSAKPPVARPAFLPKEGPPGLPGAKGRPNTWVFKRIKRNNIETI